MSNKIKEKKHRLLKTSDDYEEILNENITVVSETAREWGGKILLIGGVMILSYLGVRAIIGKKKHKYTTDEIEFKSSRTEARNIFIKSLSDKAALVLLAIAREYIVKLLKDKSDEHD